MTKVLKIIEAGPRESNGPRPAGENLQDFMENSNEPMAVAYSENKAVAKAFGLDDRLFKDVFPNTELGVDLKVFTREPGRLSEGEYLAGVITRDGEYHYSFFPNYLKKKWMVMQQRNPHIYEGKRINVNRKDDGTLYPTFNRPPFTEEFTFQDFCREAAEELLMVAGLVEEKEVAE